MKNIQIIVKPDGQIEIEAHNFKGGDCEKATAFLEKALGRVKRHVRKADFYAGSVRHEQQIGG